MQIVIDIPEEEFGIDINDKFKDFFSRLKVEIKQHLMTNTSLVCGAYELEIIDMFLKAFNNGTPLPKGHGRLIEVNKLLNMTKSYKSELGGLKADPFVESGIETVESFIKELPTIIEADRSGKE